MIIALNNILLATENGSFFSTGLRVTNFKKAQFTLIVQNKPVVSPLVKKRK